MNNQEDEVIHEIQQVERRLDTEILFEQFTPKAKLKLKEYLSQYVRNLITESARISKYHRTDDVSESHVIHAESVLRVKKRDWLSNFLLTIGGIILGAGIPALYQAVIQIPPNVSSITYSIVLTVLGVALIAVFIGKSL